MVPPASRPLYTVSILLVVALVVVLATALVGLMLRFFI
jgi:hypothetical protein